MDFSGKERKYHLMKVSIETMDIPEANKKASIEFVESCSLGMYGKKIGKERAERVLLTLKNLCKMLPEGKVVHDITKVDIKSLLLKIDEHPGWGDWEKYVSLSVLRKFMTWIRTEYGYPPGYPDREKLLNMLPLMKFAPECKYSIQKPNKLKNINEIPTAQEIQWLMDACDTFQNKVKGIRNKAIIAIFAEIGARVGGVGKRNIGDVTFDQIGALLIIHDKSMIGEPVRLIKSVPYLKAWLEVHPLKNDMNAPLWINVRSVNGRGGGPNRVDQGMNYAGMAAALRTVVRMHNEFAESKGLPKITRRVHFHAFRYFAQGRDALAGMPTPIMCRMRGWSATSRQPQRYARISSDDVDKWLIAHS